MKRPRGLSLVGILAVALGLLVPLEAEAIPAFSRLYGFKCGACHVAFPTLNASGEEFRLSGYTRFEGGEVVPKVPPVKIGERLELPGIIPLSMLIETGWDLRDVSERERETGEKRKIRANSFNLNEVEILAGGSLGRHASFFVDFPLVETEFEDGKFIFEGPEPPELAFVALNNIFLPDLFNLKVGSIDLPLLSGTGLSPSHRRLSVAEYEIYAANARDLLGVGSGAVGLSEGSRRFRLKKEQVGVELYGNIYSELTGVPDLVLRYNIGASNADNRNPDNNRDKGIHGRLSATYLNQTIGVFAFYADNLADSGRFNNSAWRAGPDIGLKFFGERLLITSQFLYGRDDNPLGNGVPFNFYGGFIELDAKVPIKPFGDLIALGRFDYVLTDKFDDTGKGGSVRTKPRIYAWTAGLQYYFWENFKVVGEYTFRLEEEQLSRAESTRELDEVRDHAFTVRVNMVF